MNKPIEAARLKLRLQNVVRGALARLRASSTPGNERHRWQEEQLAYQQIHQALSRAKSKLPSRAVSDFEIWTAAQLKEHNDVEGRLGTNLPSLGLLPLDLRAKSLAFELAQVTAHLSARATPLLEFCRIVRSTQDDFTVGNWAAVRDKLRAATHTYGATYWSVELELAVEQLEAGVEKMKAKAAQLAVASSGAQKYLLHFIGVRNEPAQTAARYVENIERRLNDGVLKPGIRCYFRYRLIRKLSLAESELALVLSAEQLTTSIDLLFCALDVLRHIQGNNSAFSSKTIAVAEHSANQLRAFGDALGIHLAPAATADTSTAPLPITGRDAVTWYYSNPTDVDALAHAAIERHWYPIDEESLLGPNQLDVILAGVVSRLSTRSSGVASEQLAKLQLNFAGIPLISLLGDINSLPKFITVYLEYLRGAIPVVRPRTLRDAILSALSDELTPAYRSISGTGRPRNILAAVIEARRIGDDGEALRALTDVPSVSEQEFDAFMVVAAVIQQESDHQEEAVVTIARAGIANQNLISLLPLNEIFQGSRWATIAPLGPSMELSIALDLYLRATGDTRARSYKRFSVEELMKRCGTGSIIDLVDSLARSEADPGTLEYFVEAVCDIPTLELLPNVGNSRNAQQARIDLLRRLSKHVHKNELRYLEEARILEEHLGVTDGLELLDDSRVYVDESRVLTSVNRELGADFQRYLQLVRSGVGVSESFAEILKNIKTPSAKTFQIPTNDADDLFGEMTFRIRDTFLNDPAAGLDIHIGRRIRHGTIASHIRGPLESQSLIGQRPRAGADYDPPEAVLGLAIGLDAKTKTRLYAALSRFSESIDALISSLRDEYFHVRSKSKPRGMFDVPINAVFLALARSIAQTCSSIEDYSRHCLQLFWMLLAAKMEAARPPIVQETRRQINSAFEKLFLELRTLGIKDVNLHSSLQQALEELRRRVTSMGNWMRIPKATLEGKAFSMQRVVDVAVALVRGQRAGFKPIISSSLPMDLALDYYGFSVVVDLLYIVLDNVFEHSGKRVDNNINIEVQFDTETSLLRFSILSELGKDGRTSEKEARVNAIRSDIGKKAYIDRARRDRNSGLSKLAAIVLQSDQTRIEFDWVGKTHFLVKFDLHYVNGQRTQEPDMLEDLVSKLENETGFTSEAPDA